MDDRRRQRTMDDHAANPEADVQQKNNLTQEADNMLPSTPVVEDKYKVTIMGRQFNSVILMTHFNIFLYAMCFWIQTGTLPVSVIVLVHYYICIYLTLSMSLLQICT